MVPSCINDMLYTIHLLHVGEYRSIFRNDWQSIKRMFHLKEDEKEHVFDWFISHSVSECLRTNLSKTPIGYYRHDVYLAAYSETAANWVFHINNLLQYHKVIDTQAFVYKLMVAGDNLIITKGYYA